MTTPPLPPDRPIPDADDLRLLNELINNVSIPLANAAWNAQMSQSEAALRLVSMAERGLPLRLVANGDRQALWHLAQAGPAGAAPVDAPASAPVEPVPPHQQATVGAVPLGEAPFGAATAEASPATGDIGVAAAEVPSTQVPPVEASVMDPDTGAPVSAPVPPPAPAPEAPAAAPPAAAPTWIPGSVVGPAGEQLTVSIVEMIDAADGILAAAGAPPPPGYRAVLVHSRVANTGQVPFPIPGDLNLVLEDSQRMLLGRTAVALPSHPPFAPDVPAHHTVDGWSVFFVPAATTLAGIKWCIRPDLVESILSWPIPPQG